ncbi:MAG: MarR family transcriptional regulator [Sarcina sp.]
MDKEELIMSSFRDLFNKMAWLNKSKMEKYLNEYKPSEIHCIEHISRNKDSNVIKLAKACYMTRSAMSKLTKKLIEKGLIENYQKPENKKEIYFRLTKAGERISLLHENLHKEFQDRDKEVFDQISDKELNSMLNFIKSYSDHLDNEIQKENITF